MAATAPVPADDPIFTAEQAHLSGTYAALTRIGTALTAKMERTAAAAAADKRTMAEDVAPNFASDDEALETYVDLALVNSVVDGYNAEQHAAAEELSRVRLLKEQPYFAKVSLRFKPGEPAKELYLGAVGISDENCRRLVVDWRSPVAEVYYNQDLGPTSYRANGRTIHVDLELRRQFDIVRDTLRAYFDTSIAIEDELLLASLSQQRTAQMQAITATIQKEQNAVIRHDDVPALLVSGIAGSGKTSVLLQRIAYLFYQQRGSLDPREVILITPNPVFRSYIADVLPDLGESNPVTLTWAEFAAGQLPDGRGLGEGNVDEGVLARIDEAVAAPGFRFEDGDFLGLAVDGQTIVSAAQVRQVAAKFKGIDAGPHLATLVREALRERVESKLASLAGSERIQDEVLELALEEQLALFGETLASQDDDALASFAQRYVRTRFGAAADLVERDAWLDIDRIGARILGTGTIAPVAWIYLKIACTGAGDPHAKYLMVDEVQDYTAAQLAVLARYYRRANVMLLGDEHQAIRPRTASFDEVRCVFARERGALSECRLLTSYRSAPGITDLFARLLPEGERMAVSSVQRSEVPPVVRACTAPEEHTRALREAVRAAASEEGLVAVVAPWKHEVARVQKALGSDCPPLLATDDARAALPSHGVVLLTLELAKGLEFDHVIVPNASATIFPADDELARKRLYTTLSRATKRLTVLSRGPLTPLLTAEPA